MPEGDRFERSLGAGWRSAFRYAAGEVASEQEIEDKLMGSLGGVVIFTVIPAKAGIQRPLAANAYLPATGF